MGTECDKSLKALPRSLLGIWGWAVLLEGASPEKDRKTAEEKCSERSQGKMSEDKGPLTAGTS